MESFGVVPDEFSWDTLEEQMQLEDMGFSFWPYDEAGAYCSSWSNTWNSFGGNQTCHPNEPNASEEQLAPSFDQHEGLSCPNESNSKFSTEFNAGSEQSWLKKREFRRDECIAAEFPAEKKARPFSTVLKTAKNLQSKESRKGNSATGDGDRAFNGQSTSSCSSEDDDSNASPGVSAAHNLNGKTTTRRGAATDPQSLYARKRRERINERLRILQNLVPNGTKVDISTMLEEAVQYVKFLQQQIKLLSSDELWMHAPLAYKGMNIGLHLLNPSEEQ